MTVLFDLCLNNLRHFLLVNHPVAVHIVHPENRKQNRVSPGSGLSTDFIRIFGTVRILSGYLELSGFDPVVLQSGFYPVFEVS